MKINSFSIGSTPNHNEDSVAHANMGINGYAVVMADGMGGLPHGEVASKIACTTIISHIQATYKDFHSELRILKEALEKADDKIYSKGLSKYKCQMGTTIAAAIVIGHGILLNIYYKRQQGINIDQFWKEIIKMAIIPTIVAVLFYVVQKFIPVTSIIKLSIIGVVYTMAFMVVSYKFSMNDYEKNIFISVYRKFKYKITK